MKQRLEKVSNYFFDRISNRYCNDIESVLNHVSVDDYLYMESMTEGKRSYHSEIPLKRFNVQTLAGLQLFY